MIGPSGSGAESGKRRALGELDIESICDEVCGHHHPRTQQQQQQQPKRPRIHVASELQLVDPVHNGPPPHGAFNSFEPLHQQDLQPVAKLEVLLVDGNWHEAFHGFDPADAAAQSLTELTQLQGPDLQSLELGDSYWSQPEPESAQPHQPAMPRPQPGPEPHSVRTRFVGPAPAAAPPPPPVYEDQENGNLSWLLDFKLDSFIDAHDDNNRTATLLPASKIKLNGSNGRSSLGTSEPMRRSCDMDTSAPRYDGPYNSSCGLAENRNCNVGPKKPPFTYTELIEHALQEKGELTVSAIYQWISEHFPYYKSNDDRWKNSVRHNLSINPHFRKGSKAPHGAGHLWAIASQDESRHLFNIATIRQALKTEETNSIDDNTRMVSIDEVAAATASIAQPAEEEDIVDTITLEHCAEQILSGIKREVEVQYLVPMMVSNNGQLVSNQQCQQQQHQHHHYHHHHHHHQQQQQNPPVDPLGSIKETDFLNPVSKEVVAEECGLLGEGYLVTDLNPSSLGLNMAESEVVSPDNLFGEELSFQFYEFSSPSQLQSA